MFIEDALKTMRETGQRMKRSGWKAHEWVMMVDPRVYPTVEGDMDEYLVVTELNPGKLSSSHIRLSGPYQTHQEAEEWLTKERAAIHSLWARYERYQRLLSLKASTPLDYAEQPRFSVLQMEKASITASAKMSTKRLGMPYFAGMRPDKCLEVYTFTPEDFHASDWRTA